MLTYMVSEVCAIPYMLGTKSSALLELPAGSIIPMKGFNVCIAYTVQFIKTNTHQECTCGKARLKRGF